MDHKLQIVLAARDATKSAFMSAQGQVKAFTKSVFSLRGAMVATAGAAAMGAMIKKSLETADAIGKAADAIGISTDTLQEYRHAARISGVETASLDKSIGQFAKRVGEARAGTGAMITYLKKFDEQLLSNIQKSKSTDEALDLVFKRLGQTASATDKAALANAAFGRSGLTMVNMVKEGAEGLARLRQEARDLGIVMDEQLIRQSEKANDEIEKLTRVLKVQFMSAAVGLAPEIARLAENTTNWWKANQDLVKTDVAAFADKIKGTVIEIKAVYDALPDGVIGPAGAGLIGTILLGPVGGVTVGLIAAATQETLKVKKELQDIYGSVKRYLTDDRLFRGAGATGSWGEPETPAPTSTPPPVVDTGGADRGKELSTELQQYYGWWSAYGDSMEEFYTTNSKVYLDTTKSDIEKSKEAFQEMYSDLKFQSEDYYQYRLEQLQQQAADYEKYTGDTVLAHQWLAEQIKALDQERLDAAGQTNQWLVDMSERTSDAIEENFSKFFRDFFGGELDSAEEYFRAFCNSLSDSFSDMMGQMMKEMMFGGGSGGGSGGGGFFSSLISGIGGLFGGGGGGGGGGGYNAADWATTLWHKGGTVGQDTAPTRTVPASLFAHAPRLHGGLAPDEFPAILQQGETVIPRGQSATQVKNLTISVPVTIEGQGDDRLASILSQEMEETAKRVMREEMR